MTVSWKYLVRVSKWLLATGLLGTAAVGLLEHFVPTMSNEAIVSARLFDVVSPIRGRVSGNRWLAGTAIESGARVAEVEDCWADRGQVTALERDIAQQRAALTGLPAVANVLELQRARVETVARSHQREYLTQCEADVDSKRAELTALQGARDTAAEQLARIEVLLGEGLATESDFELARQAHRQAVAELTRGQKALSTALSNLGAARKGLALAGGSGGGQIETLRRLDDLSVASEQLSAEQTAGYEAMLRLEELLDRTKNEQSGRTHAELRAPFPATLWEVHAAPGSTVREGERIVSLVDCSELFVLATVPHRLYAKLDVGVAGIFEAHGGESFPGEVTQLLGTIAALAEMTSILAPGLRVAERSPFSEDYVVLLRVPELVERSGTPGCAVGISGKVHFVL